MIESAGRAHSPNHNRPRRIIDLALNIKVFIPDGDRVIEYRGTYVDHGLYKTVYRLTNDRQQFHHAILKVTPTKDVEPSVFIDAARYGLSTRILYNCWGRETRTNRRWHCWIVEPTIPLDKFINDRSARSDRCALAAFICLLKGVLRGLIIDDTNICNFGVKEWEFSKEHCVVIIDAGSRGWASKHEVLKKRRVTKTCMNKFWRNLDGHDIDRDELYQKWSDCGATMEGCLQWAESKWEEYPWLTTSTCVYKYAQQRSSDEKAKIAEMREAQVLQHALHYDVLKLLTAFLEYKFHNVDNCAIWKQGLAVFETHFQRQCCDPGVLKELADLADRFFFNRTDETIDPLLFVEAFVQESVKRQELLNQRSQWAQQCDVIELTEKEVSRCHHAWAQHFLETQLTCRQQRDPRFKLEYGDNGRLKLTVQQRSFVSAMLHKYLVSKHLALAVWQIGLPAFLTQSTEPEARLLESSAQDMAEWLTRVGEAIRSRKTTAVYREHARRSGSTRGQPALTQEDHNMRKHSCKRLRVEETPIPEERRGKRPRHKVPIFRV